MANNRYRRILVQVTDQEIADQSLGNTMATMLRPKRVGLKMNSTFSYSPRVPSQNCHADIDVLNCTTLSLTKKNVQDPETSTNEIMCFDCVGRTDSDPLLRNEISNMFDMLMIDRHNCCLVHIKPLRDTPTTFFNNILMPEVDKRLAMLQGTLVLESIKLDGYYDIRKYDVVNLLNKNRSSSRLPISEITFRNTRELLRWTQRAYPSLWFCGSEHESFDLEFVFVEAPNELGGFPVGNKIHLRLSVLLFYLNKMDGDMRVGLRNFLENLNQSTLRIKNSIITDYLREYLLNEKEHWHVWMLFDVPQINYGSSLTNDILTLANAAYTGIHNDNTVLNNSNLDLLFESSNQKLRIPRQVGGSSFSISQRKLTMSDTDSLKPSDIKMVNYSLSFWYCRIEECFTNVITTMEKYYDRKYELKVQKMCGDLQHIARNIDKDMFRPNNRFIDDKDIDTDESLQSYFKQYREAISEFRILIHKIERTKYAQQLNVFITIKNNEITKQTRQMKVRLLELCQTRLSNTIKDEVKTLNSEEPIITKRSESLTKTTKSNC